METTSTPKRGGRREGAGRKRTVAKKYMLYASQTVAEILEAVEGSKSEFICQCIIKATNQGKP